jgi:hypothetical protein
MKQYILQRDILLSEVIYSPDTTVYMPKGSIVELEDGLLVMVEDGSECTINIINDKDLVEV